MRRFALVSRTVDAPEIPAPAPQPDPRLGAPGPHRRLGRAPARSQRAGHRAVQAPERPRGEDSSRAAAGGEYPEEIDLRAEDDALIAAELEAAEAEAERALAEAAESDEDEDEDDADGSRARPAAQPPRRARGRAGARNTSPLEGTFDHGEEGYGLWLDPAIQDNPIYAEHWAGHRPVEVTIEEDRIVIRRVGDDDE